MLFSEYSIKHQHVELYQVELFDLKSTLTQSSGKLSNMWFSYPLKLAPTHIDQANRHTLTHILLNLSNVLHLLSDLRF